jgi:predicted deacylase
MAHSFGVPVMINSNLRDGSLRQCADELGVPMLLFEAGEALRFDEMSIRSGTTGVFNVLCHLDMLTAKKSKKIKVEPLVARKSGWVRAPDSGLVIHKKSLGDIVVKDEVIAIIKTPLGKISAKVLSNANGIIIGKQNIPLVHEGEAVYHIAYFKNPDDVVENLELMQENLDLLDS